MQSGACGVRLRVTARSWVARRAESLSCSRRTGEEGGGDADCSFVVSDAVVVVGGYETRERARVWGVAPVWRSGEKRGGCEERDLFPVGA